MIPKINFRSIPSIIIILLMVAFTAVIVLYEIEVDSLNEDTGLMPAEKIDQLFNAPEKKALARGIPVVYENINEVSSGQLLDDNLSVNEKKSLIVTITPIMDGFGKDWIGLTKRYQFDANISTVEYSAPKFYLIESHNNDSVVLKKDRLGISGQMAFTGFAWLMGEIFLFVVLLAFNIKPMETKEESKT